MCRRFYMILWLGLWSGMSAGISDTRLMAYLTPDSPEVLFESVERSEANTATNTMESSVADVRTSVTPADFETIRNPAMRWAVEMPGQTARFSKDPSVIRLGDRVLLYFSLPPQRIGERQYGWTVGVAESTTPLPFSALETSAMEPIVSESTALSASQANFTGWKLVANLLPTQTCDAQGLAAPCAKVFGNRVFLFYQTYGNGPKDAICCAWSDDGVHFTPHPQNPIFRPTGDWTNGRAIDADLIRVGEHYLLYAATRDSAGKIQKLVVATAAVRDPTTTDIMDPVAEFAPTSWTQACNDAILSPELPWETQCIEAPTVLERDGVLVMFYAGGYNNDPQHIGVAYSEDGIRWKRYWRVPLITHGPADQWNASESGHPGVFVDRDGSTYLFYQGNATNGRDWYLSRVRLTWETQTAEDGRKIPVPRVITE